MAAQARAALSEVIVEGKKEASFWRVTKWVLSMPGNLIRSCVIGEIIAIIAGMFWFNIDVETSSLSIMLPQEMSLIMAPVSVGLAVNSLIRPVREVIFAVDSNQRWIVTGALFFAWVVVMPYVGFLVSTIAAVSVTVWYLASATMTVGPAKFNKWLPNIGAIVVFFYMIFTLLLHAPLPEGRLI